MNKSDFGNAYSVYILTFPDGKKYVGMTRQKDVSRRWHGGCGYKNQQKVKAEIDKFGWSSVEHEIIATCLNLNDASELERSLIKQFSTKDPRFGLNHMGGGQTSEHTDEFKRRLSERMKGNKYCVGRKLSESHVEALRASNLGANRPSKNKGRSIHTEERKRLFSEMAKERWRDPEMRQKYLNSQRDIHGKNNPMYGKKHSEGTKQIISQKARERLRENPDCLKRTIESHIDVGKKVNQYDLEGNLINTFPTCRKAGQSVNGNGSNICFACKHSNRTYKGFVWRYAE